MKVVMTTSIRITVIIALLAVSVTALAQEKEEMPEMTPEMQAEMEAWMKLAQPGAHHEHLAPFVGTWKGKVTMWMGPEQPPIIEETVADVTWLLGGRFLQWTQKGRFGDMPFEGMAIEGYNMLLDRTKGIQYLLLGERIQVGRRLVQHQDRRVA